jgi:hypothetical protein
MDDATRTPELFAQAIRFAKLGGNFDFTVEREGAKKADESFL